MGQGGFGAGGAGGAAKEAWKYVTDKTKDIGSGAKHTVKSLSDGAKKMINTTKGALGAAGTWAKEKQETYLITLVNQESLLIKF